MAYCSLAYILKETDHTKGNIDPLFEVQLHLRPPEMTFSPTLNYGDMDGFHELIEGLISIIFKQGSLIQRVAKYLGPEDYKAIKIILKYPIF